MRMLCRIIEGVEVRKGQLGVVQSENPHQIGLVHELTIHHVSHASADGGLSAYHLLSGTLGT